MHWPSGSGNFSIVTPEDDTTDTRWKNPIHLQTNTPILMADMHQSLGLSGGFAPAIMPHIAS
ncbi:MAG: hypothetical protein CSYNP_00861 [Syntrophus sp. SKADARSKE-3]|nr:hypothetical protein [Syntrophus sp. SKADARSKE-3]